MYNLLIAAALGVVTFVGVALILQPIAGIIPGVLVSLIAILVLTRRTGRQLDAEMQKLVPLLQAQRVEEARAHLQGLKDRYARWQVLLEGQIDAQLGMLDYLQMKWDEALPKLQRGRFRNWQAQTCIGAIHARKGAYDQAWEELESASKLAPKELVLYLVYVNLLLKAGERNKALEVLGRGLENLPDNELLQQLQKDVANKRKVRTDRYPETWYQFFPEDLLKSHLVRGRRGPQPPGPQPRIGARMAPRR